MTRAERKPRTLGQRWALGLVAATLACCLGAPSARAGAYVMRNCDVPGHGNASIGPWDVPTDVVPTIEVLNNCAVGGGMEFAVSSPLSGGTEVGIVLKKPSKSPQAQIRMLKAMVWYAARLGGSGTPLHFWSIDAHADGTINPGVFTYPPGSESLSFEQLLTPEVTSYFALGLKCGADGVPPPEPCRPAAAVPLQIRGMEVTLSEDIAPVIAQPGGTLLDPGPQSGVRTLMYSASDMQSGLSKVDLLLDGVPVATHDLTSRCAYSDFTVCPASDDGTLQIDTRSVANGTHAVAVRVQDAAGNERMVRIGNPIEVANGPSVGLTASPTHAVTVGFKGSSRSTLTIPYGRTATIRGRVTQGAQVGDAGAELEVLERMERRGATEMVVGRVRAREDGSFAYVLPAGHPSRKLRLAYRPTGATAILSPALRLRVRAGSSVRASLRGLMVRFSGRVRGGPIPRNGKLVRMEGRAPGADWKSFATLRTNRHGRFAGRYRLRVRRPGVRLKVRAIVPAERGYPFAGAKSQQVTLRVH